METIKSFFEGIIWSSSRYCNVYIVRFVTPLEPSTGCGSQYKSQPSTFWMFIILGFVPPTAMFTGFVGGYAMIFGTKPDWIFNIFG